MNVLCTKIPAQKFVFGFLCLSVLVLFYFFDASRTAITVKHRRKGGREVIHRNFTTEEKQRKVQRDVKLFWHYIKGQLRRIENAAGWNGKVLEIVRQSLEDGGEQAGYLQNDLLKLHNASATWREKEANDLSSIVQRRLHYIQNPKNCSSARKLVCVITDKCGFGCSFHRAVACLRLAYGTGRTLILDATGWSYTSKGWKAALQSVSETCTDDRGVSKAKWEDQKKDDAQVIHSIPRDYSPRPNYLSQAIPEDLAPRLTRLHDDPSLWWYSQFVKYLFKPIPGVQGNIDGMAKKIGFKSPIVGLQIRRTDKVTEDEADFYGLKKYMQPVEEYYSTLELRQAVKKRRVFLATDDPSVVPQAQKMYPEYEFLFDERTIQLAGTRQRYTESSLVGTLADLYFLSRTDYLVCTFSSNMCRLAYQIMQTLHADASTFAYSLDHDYHVVFEVQPIEDEVIRSHEALTEAELDLSPGNVVMPHSGHNPYLDGFSRSSNSKPKLYPKYKTVRKLWTLKMPTYPEADLKKP